MKGNDHPGPALVYFDSVKHYPRTASRANGGDALRSKSEDSVPNVMSISHLTSRYGTMCSSALTM